MLFACNWSWAKELRVAVQVMRVGTRALARVTTGSSVFSGFFVDNTTVVTVSHGLGPMTPNQVMVETLTTSGIAFIAYRNPAKVCMVCMQGIYSVFDGT